MRARITALILTALATTNLHAQTAPTTTKTSISIDCAIETNDDIGTRLCTALRDSVASSPRYHEDDHAVWVLHIATVAVNGNASAQAVALNLRGMSGFETYIAMWVYVTGGSRVPVQADSILASADDQIHKLMETVNTKPK